jgi:hypothetical protein
MSLSIRTGCGFGLTWGLPAGTEMDCPHLHLAFLPANCAFQTYCRWQPGQPNFGESTSDIGDLPEIINDEM